MTARRRTAFVVAATLLAAQVSVPLSAAPSAPSKVSPADQAAALKKEGDQAMMELRYEDALDAYGRSYALVANPALHYNRGRALEALGRYAEALDAYDAFEADASPELRAKVPALAAHVKDLKKRVAHLTLKIAPSGARIVLRSVVLGSAPLAGPVRVNAGKGVLEVTADGYLPYKKEVELPGGESVVLDVALEAKSAGGVLVVHSDPTASVSVDGTAMGTTPMEAPVSPGSHTITLSRSGYATRTTTVVVNGGEKKQLSLSLDAESGITSKWWFWTGIGVVVVGATAVTVGMLTSRDAGKGDIDPGRISAPLVSF